MNIEHLREFVVLAQAGHYMEAASRLYISQSTLSKHIKALEAQLEVPLFNRTTRKVSLSEYGEILLPYAQRILELEGEYSSALFNARELESSSIAIGSIPALAPYGITDLLVRFKREHPGYTFTIVQNGTPRLLEMLRAGEIELAFVREAGICPKPDEAEFVRIPYTADSMVVVLPDTHPLCGQKSIELARLEGEEFVMVEQNNLLHELCVHACRESGFTPRIAYTDHKVENLLDVVQKGMGVGLLMEKLALHNPVPGVSVSLALPRVSSSVCVYYRKNTPLSRPARHFLEHLHEKRRHM